MLEFVGNDGLTDLERQAAEQRWQDRVARRPTLKQLQQIQQRIAEHAGERMCRRRGCGHPERAHEHHRDTDYCAWCGSSACKAFLPPRPQWWPRWWPS